MPLPVNTPTGSRDDPLSTAAQRLRVAAARGGAWTAGAIAILSIASLAAQLTMAIWLSSEDYGLFALAISTTFVFGVLGVGGSRTLLTRLDPDEIARIAKSTLRYNLILSSAAAAALVLLSLPLSQLFDQPGLKTLIVVLAIGLPLRAYSNVAIPIAQSRLQFRAVAVALVISAIAQYGSSVALAVAGFGAVSLAVGTTVSGLVLSVALLPSTFAVAWTGTADIRIKDLLGRGRWALTGDLAVEASSRIDYLALGLSFPVAVVGVYYFAFQLVSRAGEFVAVVSRNVLFPVFARVIDDDSRQRRAITAGSSVLVLVAAFGASILIAATPTIERVAWGGKWAEAILPVALLATVLPIQAALSAPEQMLKAQGQFRSWSGILAVRATGIFVVASILGVWLPNRATATEIAAAMAVFLIIEATLEVWFLGHKVGFNWKPYFRRSIFITGPLVTAGWIARSMVELGPDNPALRLTVGIGVLIAGSGLSILIVRRAIRRELGSPSQGDTRRRDSDPRTGGTS